MSEITMIDVSSSNIESIGYDEESMILRIKFLNSSIYDYKNVPKIEYDALLNASSVGSYLNRNIKGVYAYEKVG